jgi:predicted GIY-YIG superfamily endonuclease
MKEFIKNILRQETLLIEDQTPNEIGNQKYWTYEKVIETAKQFTRLKDFSDTFPRAYSVALKNGYIDEIKSFLEHGKRNYWSIDKVLEIAKEYDTIKDFRIANKQAYDIAVHYGWLDELKKILKSSRGDDWTYERVKEIASKYTTLSDFHEKDNLAYLAALRHGWSDEITKHMIRVGNLVKRAVYAFEFPDNSVYVGLTLDLGRREKQHLSDEGYSAVSNHIKKTNLTPYFKKISDEYLDSNDASNLEKCTINNYISTGWKILNKMKAGGLGYACIRVYTYQKVKEDASKFQRPSEFKKQMPGSYSAAIRNGWLDEVTAHMKKMKRKINRQDVIDKVNQYEYLNDFQTKEPSYYNALRREGWYDLLSKLKRKERVNRMK